MSTPPETPSPRIILREFAGLLLAAVGIVVALAALGAIHVVVSTSVGAVGALAAFHFPAPPRTRGSRILARTGCGLAVAAAIGCTLLYFPLLGWVEVGVGISAAGIWLASEGV